KATKPVQPGTLARLLVDHGHLTETQGERLAGGPLPASRKSASHSGVLGLEPIGQTPAKTAKVPVKSQAEVDRAAEELGLAPLHDEPKPAAKMASAAAVGKPAAPVKPAAAPQAKPKEKLVPVVDGLMPLEELPSTATKPTAAKASQSTITKSKPTAGSTSTIAKAKSSAAPVAPLVEGLAPLPG